MSGYRLKPGPLGRTLIRAYRKVERGAVRGYKAVETAFVSAFLERDDDRKA